MKKPIITEPTTKTVLYQSDDNSVELYSLTRNGITETYLRRGSCIELVEGTPSLNWKPEKATYGLYPDTSLHGSWTQSNGLKIKTLPKLKAR